MRISHYFPSLGYEAENEISNSIERQKRKMKAQEELKKLESPMPEPYDYEFINLDAIVSTSGDQTAIGQGDLIKRWSSEGRNYFHYKTDRPVPFRFAFSSAQYELKKEFYKNISIEIYYDPRHSVNVNRLIAETKKTLEYCESNFGAFPHHIIRFAEVSSFAEGFAATSYPTTIYMKENQGFYANAGQNDHAIAEVINQLAGHELSHQWWGCSQLSPEYKEGAWLLSETLAKYTELTLYEKAYGHKAALEKVRLHLDIYLSNRSFSKETPLYKTSFETPHLAYDKGLVIMYQLRNLIGENNVNAALKALLLHHAYPNLPAGSNDLLNEIYKQSPAELHQKIDEMFKEIVIYDSKIEDVNCSKKDLNEYDLRFTAGVEKFIENGYGKRRKASPDQTTEVGIYSEAGYFLKVFPIENGKVHGTIKLKSRALKIVLDPEMKTIDSFLNDNEAEVR